MSETAPALPYKNIAGAATTVIKSGYGVLHAITINTKGTTAVATVFDNTAGSGNKIATIDLTSAVQSLFFDAAFSVGLTIVTTGSASDITVSYR